MSTPSSNVLRPRPATGWSRALLWFAIAVAIVLVAYWPSVRSLVGTWANDGTYQYAFLIFPISAWLVYDLRQRLRANAPKPSVWGLLAVAALIGLWYVGHVVDINLVQHFALVCLFPALVLACWGWRAAWTLLFPLVYLVVFAVPWGDGMVGPLQDITAHFAVRALDITGVPVLLNGREILTPSAVWMVEEACSGVRFFIACAALGCLFAYLMYQRTWKRVAFVVLSAVVPIIANGLRVYFTVLIGETWGLKYATGTDHLIFGWQFFGTVLVLLLLAGWFFRDQLVARKPPVARSAKPLALRVAIWPLALMLLATAPIAAHLVAPGAVPDRIQLAAPVIANWGAPAPADNAWSPQFHGAAGQALASYQADTHSTPIALFHAVYLGRSRPGHDLITYGNNVYDPATQRVLSAADRHIDFRDGPSVAAKELRLASANGARLVWYWYAVDGHCTASPIVVKLLQAWATLRGHNPRSSVWALSAPITRNGADTARQHLLTFAQALPITSTANDLAGNASSVAENHR